MNVTAKEIAAALDGIEYPASRSISRELREQAKKAGLVIVYGSSDDLMVFAGAIEDEVDCFAGGMAYLTSQGLVRNECDDRCPYFGERLTEAVTIEALWCEGVNYTWTYRTDIPHETFEVMEDGFPPYCRGIVFALADVSAGKGREQPAIGNQREDFELWARHNPYFGYSPNDSAVVDRDGDGYQDANVQAAWLGWQEASSAARPPIDTSQITSMGRNGLVITLDCSQPDLDFAEEYAEKLTAQLAEYMQRDYGGPPSERRDTEKEDDGYFRTVGELKDRLADLPSETVILCQVVAEDGTVWQLFPRLSGILEHFKWAVPVVALTATHPELKTLPKADD